MNTESEESSEQYPWAYIAGAALLFAAAWSLYHTFTDLEQSGGSVRIHIFGALLYKVFGKWGVVGALGLGGAVALYRGARGLLQTPPAIEDTDRTPISEAEDVRIEERVDRVSRLDRSATKGTVRPPISEAEDARIEERVDRVSRLIRNAPLLLTWMLLAYSVQELVRYPALLPPTVSRSAQSLYTIWIILPFLLPAVFSFVFRADFIEAVGLFFGTLAMTFMSFGVIGGDISPSGRFTTTSSLVWVPVAQLAWTMTLIHLLNRRRDERAT